MSEDIQVSISQESIQSIVRARIQTELFQALTKDGGGERIIQALVTEALSRKVKPHGGGYTEIPFITDLVEQMIQAETRKAFVAWLEGNRDKIQGAILKAIEKDKTLPVRILSNLLEGAANQYRCTVEIKPVDK
jgi:cell division ATPase FtsA